MEVKLNDVIVNVVSFEDITGELDGTDSKGRFFLNLSDEYLTKSITELQGIIKPNLKNITISYTYNGVPTILSNYKLVAIAKRFYDTTLEATMYFEEN